MKKRLEYLDMAKGVGAICVLLGHLQGVEIFLLTPYILPMCQWIFSFHMPLFFIISGMLINYKNDISKDMTDIVKKRFRGLIIPYFWISAIQLLVVLAAIVRGASTFKDAGVHIFHIFSFYGIGVMWFLPALFAAEVMFIFIMKKWGHKIGTVIVTVLGAVALYVADYQMDYEYVTDFSYRVQDVVIILTRPFVAMTFIAIGYYGFNLYKDKSAKKAKKLAVELEENVSAANTEDTAGILENASAANTEDTAGILENASAANTGVVANAAETVAVEAVVVENSDNVNKDTAKAGDTENRIKGIAKNVLGVLAGLAIIYIGMVFMPVNMGVDFRSLVLKNEFFYYFCALTNSFGIILVCKCLGSGNILSRVLGFYGTNSLIFMFTHNSDKVLYYALNLSMWVNQYLTRARGHISYAVIVLVILAYTTVMIFVINRFFPFVIGKPFTNPFRHKKV